MNPLIITSSYVANQRRVDEVKLSTRLMRRLNPDTPILLIDSASPFDPQVFLDNGCSVPDVTTFVQMGTNAGHPTVGGDGWGRDLCFGLQYAIERSYDWAVFIESDLMFCRPIAPILDKLHRIGCYFSAPMNFTYGWLETGLMFFYVPLLIQTKFVERYSWHSHRPPFYCEAHVESLLADEFLALPLRGRRDDANQLTPQNLAVAFPSGLDYLTHCQDFSVYLQLLKMHSLNDLWFPSPKGAY